MAGGRHRQRYVREVAPPGFAGFSRYSRHSRRVGQDSAITAAVVTVLVCAAVLSSLSLFRSPIAGRPVCPGWTTATVVASSDQATVLRQIADRWVDHQPEVGGECADIRVVSRSSAEMASSLNINAAAQTVAARPDVWAPESSVWSRLAATRPEASAALPAKASSLAVTPVIIAVPRARAAALGWPSHPPTWQTLLTGLRSDPTWGRYGHPEWGRFVIGMSDPTKSTAGLHTLLALTDANGDGAVEEPEITNELLLERAIGRYANDTPDLLNEVGSQSSTLAAFPATEQSVLAYDQSAEANPLVPIYPAEAVPDADHPFLILRAPWVSAARRAVAQAFLQFALGPEGRAAYARAGFRDPDRTVTRLAANSANRDLLHKTYPTRPLMGAAPTAQVLVRWRAIRYPANVLAAIDTSGSMAEKAPGLPTTKLAVLQAAAVQAVRLFNIRSTLGVWEFSGNLTKTTDYLTLVPPRELGAPVGGHNQRDVIIAAVAQLRAGGFTGLYDTISAGYTFVQRTWTPTKQNILVVMTDGKNEDPSGITLSTLVHRLAAARDPRKPITVILIAYGASADVVALNQVGTATGGRLYICRNPADIGRVFLAAMVNR